MAGIKLDKEISKSMFQHAVESYPEECCGFLFGTEDNESNREFTEIMIVENVKLENRKIRFEIDPLDYMKAEQKAEHLGLKLLSIYHTHPDHPAEPSEHDRVQAVPYFSYIIMSVNQNEVVRTRSWRLNSSEFFDEEDIYI
jgi:proteasome lid subunit RPN8/RPN11